MRTTRTGSPGRSALSALSVLSAQRVAKAVLAAEGATASVSITFLGPTRMGRLNREHLGHDYPTDVISFALPGPNGSLAGDIYVCRAVAVANARAHGLPLREELVRLVVHGTLHVLGYDHPEGETRVHSAMWRRQERYVSRFLRRSTG